MLEATKARVAPVSSAMLYGRGVFTTVAIHNGSHSLYTKHTSRLSEQAQKLGIELTGLSEKSLAEALTKLIAVNPVEIGRARVILLARSGRDSWKTKGASNRQTDVLIM